MNSPQQCKEDDERLKRERPESPAPSCVSMKSDHSRHEPPNFSSEPHRGDKNPRHEERPESPAPSCVSMKSDHSWHEPPNFSLEPHGTDKSEVMDSVLAEDIFQCDMCKEKLKDLVHIPCGYRYCRQCICKWDLSKPVQAQQTEFSPVHPGHCCSGSGDVACDFCTGVKLRAVKSCLTCPASLCENHVRLHHTIPALQRHTLVEVTGDLEQRLCQQHHRVLEVFCKTDQTDICKVCAVEEHKGHSKIYRAVFNVPDTASLLSMKLKNMKTEDFKTFKTELKEGYPECFGSQLEDLDVSGVVEKMLESFGELGTVRITMHLTDNSLRVKEANKINMRKKFQNIKEGIAQQSREIVLNEVYTELYITEGGNGEVNNEHEVRQIEMTSKREITTETSVKCNDIFTTLPGQRKQIRAVLTKGIAGIGKTVSVQKFILDWAEGKANQDIINVIVPLPFRDLNLKKDTYSLIKLLYQYAPELREIRDIEDERVKMLFIFDGLDECRFPLDFQKTELCSDVTKTTSVDVLLTNLIKGNLLPSALVWITSRPAAANQIPPECVHRVTEIRGFNDLQREEYFRKRISDQSLANRIITHMKLSRSLYIMCHIPVFCWLSATVLDNMMSDADTGEIPKTLTAMYTHFLLIQISLKNKKYHGVPAEDPKNLHQSDKEMIMKLGELAFKQLEKGNLIFYEEDLRNCGIDVGKASEYSSVCTEIFREELGLYREKVFCFVHLTIQEHLAAVYAHVSCVNADMHVFKPSRQTNHVGKPLVGMDLHKTEYTAWDNLIHSDSDLPQSTFSFNGYSSPYNPPQKKVEPSPESNINSWRLAGIHCPIPSRFVFTSHQKLPVHGVSQDYPDFCILPRPCQCIPQCRLACNKTNSVLLPPDQHTSCRFRPVRISAQTEHIQPDKYTSSLSVLHRSAVDKALQSKNGHLDLFLRFLLGLSEPSNQTLLQDLVTGSQSAIEHNTANTIQIIKRKIREELCPERIINLFHCLNELNDNSLVEEIQTAFQSGTLSDKQLEPDQCSALAYMLLMSEEVLDEFDLKMYKTSAEGQQRLLPLLRNCRIASLAHCSLSSESCEIVASSLQLFNSALRKLDLSNNDLTDLGVKLLCTGMMSPNCKLEELRLENCNLSSESCLTVGSALQSLNLPLRELDISYNNLNDSGVKLLCAGLISPNCCLVTLRLFYCHISSESCVTVASALKSVNSSLINLDLSHNNLKDSGVTQLFPGLLSPNCKLQRLKLSVCSLTDGCCVDLASVLKSPRSNLTELDLRDNDLQDSGVKLLSAGLEDPNCKLQKLGLSSCLITEEGCASLASALHSNPSHLRELDLSYNHPGESGGELLSTLLEDPHCKLEKLSLHHGGECRMKPRPQKYYCQLTLDQNTAHRSLSLSERKRRVKYTTIKRPYSDHPERYTLYPQVLCREPLAERCYWEVEWRGEMDIGVTYKTGNVKKSNPYIQKMSLSNKGVSWPEVSFGMDKRSFGLVCNRYVFYIWHNAEKSAEFRPPPPTTRVGVYLNRAVGILSFYSIFDHTLTLLHTFQTKFSEPLYAGFRVYRDSEVTLC